MATAFRLDLLNFNNQIIEPDIDMLDLQYSRTFGSTGSMVVTIPDTYDEQMFGRDSMLKLYRTPDNGPTILEPGAVWFARKVAYGYTSRNIILTCVDQIDLLRRRLVGYRQYTTMADKTYDEGTQGPADDLMRAYVRENMGSSAVVDGTAIPDTDRDMTKWIYVGPDLSLGPIVEHSAAFQSVADALGALRGKAKDAGVDVYYDMVVRSDGTFEFVTPLSSPGGYNDTESDQFVLKAEDGNLSDLIIERDYTDEVTFAYVTCGGVGIGQHYIKVASNRDTLTPFNRIETHIGAEENNDTFLADIAYATLEGGKPVVRVSAKVIDSPFATYGRDFHYGDRVLVSVGGMIFDCYINSISNRVSDRGENLDISLEGYIASDPDSVNEIEVWSIRNFVHATSVSGYVEIADS